MRPEQKFALEWLHKAKNDLLSAKIVLESEYGITDVPCFHAQQTAEKSLKGFLTWHNVSFGKTHDLMVLLAEVVKISPDFDEMRSVCAELAEFAVDVRYPGGISEPPEGEAERFISEAEKILIRVEHSFNIPGCE
jgi:HEPN domain-containing protein